MSITNLAGTVHKWLALVVLLPILFWFGSGLFFALSPIEQVRSEHLMARTPALPIAVATAASGLKRLADQGIGTTDRIELRMLLDKPVALVSHGKDRPKLFDLATGVQINPLSSAAATAVARQDYRGSFTVDRVVAVTQNSPEYRGALPAWEVRLKGDTGLSIYVAADTGLVTARRSALWRTYDFLWGLHILDLREHEDFNSWLLVLAVGSSLILLVSGIILIPERLGWIARWRRAKPA